MIVSSVLRRFTAQTSDLHFWQEIYPWLEKTASGEKVSADTAMGLAAYFGCVRNISEDLGKLPFGLFEKMQPRGRRKSDDHPVGRFLDGEPNPEMTWQTFRETLTAHACNYQIGVAEIVRDRAGFPAELWPLDPTKMQPERDVGMLTWTVRLESGEEKTIPDRNVFVVHGISREGLVGYNVPRLARQLIGASLAAQKFAGAFFGNGMALGGWLEHPAHLGEDALKHLRETLEKRHAGAENANKILIAEEGMKFHETSVKPEEAQFVEGRELDIEDVCRWFRMPPHKVQHLKRATFSNIEEQNIDYVTDTLMPWFVRWEMECARKFLLNAEKGRLFFKFNATALLRGDASKRAAFYQTMFQTGAMSTNDILELEDRNPVENGDTRYVPMNLQELGAEPKPASPPPPEAPQGDQDLDVGARLIEVHRPAIEDALLRCLTIEQDKAARAQKRGELSDWSERFYGHHGAYVQAAIMPALRVAAGSICAITGRNLPDMTPFAAAVAARHVRASLANLAEAAAGNGWPARMATEGAKREAAELLSYLSKESAIPAS